METPIAKPVFSSWTIWFGLGQIAFGGIGLVTGWIDQQTAFTLIATGFASIGLRLKTTQPVV